uniref:t-SNARE coiled-coil homology domain-containing protein n=1 Tax=Proboscia inermis TaxID=420281 RepID=A0A7S0CFC9_9STRA|mmetsp:Transcript_44834/g.45279  ORF Transcript_44834/g.45279 Transcript_44834/m.45279 type:complete len:104 (+) Transcript_44834:107-418(+)
MSNSQFGTLSATQLAMEEQDSFLDDISAGVSRLKDQGILIHDEAGMQNKLLDEIEGDVEQVHSSMEKNTRRAEQIIEEKSLFRLKAAIAGLSVLLVLLIFQGL